MEWRRERARGEAGTHIHFEERSDWGSVFVSWEGAKGREGREGAIEEVDDFL